MNGDRTVWGRPGTCQVRLTRTNTCKHGACNLSSMRHSGYEQTPEADFLVPGRALDSQLSAVHRVLGLCALFPHWECEKNSDILLSEQRCEAKWSALQGTQGPLEKCQQLLQLSPSSQ